MQSLVAPMTSKESSKKVQFYYYTASAFPNSKYGFCLVIHCLHIFHRQARNQVLLFGCRNANRERREIGNWADARPFSCRRQKHSSAQRPCCTCLGLSCDECFGERLPQFQILEGWEQRYGDISVQYPADDSCKLDICGHMDELWRFASMVWTVVRLPRIRGGKKNKKSSKRKIHKYFCIFAHISLPAFCRN